MKTLTLLLLVSAITLSMPMFALTTELDDNKESHIHNKPTVLNVKITADKNNSSTTPTLDSLAEWGWDNMSLTWVLGGKLAYTYNLNGNILTESTWDGTTWVYANQFAYTYDVNGNITFKTKQSWQAGTGWVNAQQFVYTKDINGNSILTTQYWQTGTGWINSSKAITTNDANGNELSSTWQTWSGGDWLNNSMWSMQYDASNNNTNATFQTWDGANWTNSRRHLYTFDAQGNTLTELYQTPDGSSWVNGTNTIYTHDASGNTLSESYQIWNGSSWTNGYSYFFTYDSNHNLLTDIGKDQSGNNEIKYTYTYDAKNNRTSKKVQYWDNGQWGSYRSHDIYAYDTDRNMISALRQQDWNGTGWDNRDSTHYYYSGLVNGISTFDAMPDLVLYPNPTTDGLIYFTFEPALKSTKIKVFNTQGQLVQEYVTRGNDTRLDLSNLPQGIYQIVFFEADGKVMVKRVLYQ